MAWPVDGTTEPLESISTEISSDPGVGVPVGDGVWVGGLGVPVGEGVGVGVGSPPQSVGHGDGVGDGLGVGVGAGQSCPIAIWALRTFAMEYAEVSAA